MLHLLETRGPRSTTNALHIGNEDGRCIATIWEIPGQGQDELWERANRILDFLNENTK